MIRGGHTDSEKQTNLSVILGSCSDTNLKKTILKRAWCTGKTQRDRVEREVGGGIGMGNTCKSMADSCQCMTKTTTML